MAEFGGSLVDASVEAEAVGGEIVTPDPNMSLGTTREEIAGRTAVATTGC